VAINKKIVKRILITTVWSLVAAGAVVLLIAATRQQNEKVCSDVVVRVKSVDGVQYISEKNILNTISGGAPEQLKGQLIKTFDINQLEQLLEKNLWIRNAELFFDNKDVLHVDITERQPVARVFAVSGETFYVDDMGEQLPTTNDQIARVPVFTSFPTITKPLVNKDSVLLQQVKEVGAYLLKHNFWMAQVEQVNINNYEMELIPKLGNHIIQFGEGTNVDAKFNRLLLFYKQIMNKTGWNYYSSLDVRYDKQLVAVRRDSASLFKSFALATKDSIRISNVIDSLQLARDTSLALIKKDSTVLVTSKTTIQNPQSVSVKTQSNPSSIPVKNQNPPPVKTKPTTLREEENILNEAKKQSERKPAQIKPKAVMEKKN
jgi:cell division protein FtsQ